MRKKKDEPSCVLVNGDFSVDILDASRPDGQVVDQNARPCPRCASEVCLSAFLISRGMIKTMCRQ